MNRPAPDDSWPHLVREVLGSWALTLRAGILLVVAAPVVALIVWLVLTLRG